VIGGVALGVDGTLMSIPQELATETTERGVSSGRGDANCDASSRLLLGSSVDLEDRGAVLLPELGVNSSVAASVGTAAAFDALEGVDRSSSGFRGEIGGVTVKPAAASRPDVPRSGVAVCCSAMPDF